MRKWLFIILLFSGFQVVAKGVQFELNRVELPEAINLIYNHMFTQPFMLSPELADDKRLVSFKITPDIDERAFIKRYFDNMNIRISTRDGVDYIGIVKPTVTAPQQEIFTYTPRYRSVEYLTDVLRTFVDGSFSAAGSGIGSGFSPDQIKPHTASDAFSRSGDLLVFYGTKANIAKIQQVLPQLDTKTREVFVAAYVFEVQTAEHNGSGLALAAKLLNGKVQIATGSLTGSFDNYIRVTGSRIDALYELFRQDSRFHVVSSPRLRVQSGNKAQFSVGSEVPVLGGIQIDNNGGKYQSISYKNSGVIFEIQPNVRGDITDLTVSQQLSTFVKTDTGVNDSPTLLKREVSTSVGLRSGDIIVLGGLAETKSSEAETGLTFLPKSWKSSSDEKSKSDILIFLQLDVDQEKAQPLGRLK
ncbi:type II secretion system protein GspD [Providencia stuartii]|uniref:type II secretion system protein GspD n=1 Tax=Providencia stuartii TaxID=588 RepID=UPI0011220F73|nr:type II secretion system protein GspD [Providencia stuartii]